jgi:hypothetical protein
MFHSGICKGAGHWLEVPAHEWPAHSLKRKPEPDLLNSASVLASIRDLVVHLHRGNGPQAESLVAEVAAHLEGIMSSGQDPGSRDMQRAQQTMFAIDEARLLLAKRDFDGAATAARDAAREWRQQSASQVTRGL